MEQQHQSERKFLFLALIAGICFSASIAVLFNDNFTFSVFPVVAFCLSLLAFYQQHEVQPLTEGTPLLTLACFLVGTFGYSAFIRMQMPDLGSNFFLLLLTMALVIWIVYKLNSAKQKPIESVEK